MRGTLKRWDRPDLNKTEYVKWLDDYQLYMKTLRIDKTAEHGDFWLKNILIDRSENKINVIDWENYKEESNPLFDFVFFIIVMLVLEDGIEQFRDNLNGRGKLSSIVKELKVEIDNYFGFKLNLDILVR